MEAKYVSLDSLKSELEYGDTESAFIRNDIYLGTAAISAFHYHDFYELTLVFSGSIKIDINFNHQVISANEICIIRPGERHTKFPSQNSDSINIGFTTDIFESAAEYLRYGNNLTQLETSTQPLIISLGDMPIFKPEVKSLKDSLWAHSVQAEMDLRVFLIKLLSRCFPIISKNVVDYPNWISSLIKEFDHPDYYIEGLPALIRLSGKSQEYLCRMFKKHLKTTPTSYINKKRVSLAAYYLAYSKKDIISICMDCGFNSLNYFYKCFNKEYGTSPSAYRKMILLSL